ncbi:MAG: sodium-coupled permease [Planctomycetaceae bacterium]|jgi:SSS family solute:Na+ symporter
MGHGLHWIDIGILALYAAAMIALGWYCGRHQKNANEYFTGGGRMNPVLIGVSMFATLFSTISYLATPGEVLNHGPIVSLTGLLAIPIYYYIVGYLMAPVYMQHRSTSAYALLESQLGPAARTTGAVMFVLLRLMWMSTLIFFASKAILVMLDLRESWLPVVTLATGSIAISYASMGGLRAVVVTDAIQFLLLFCGAWCVIGIVTYDAGGIGWLPTSWNRSWDEQPWFTFDPTVRVTVVGSIVHGVLWWVCTAGADQTAIQRFMATKDADAARRSFLVNSLAGGAVTVMLMLLGFALLFYYQTDASRLPAGKTIAANGDELFPYFISNDLPVGLTGLVMCGLFAAAMSSVDSGINSITAVVTTDLIDRFRATGLDERSRIRLARWLALTIGLVVLLLSSFVIEHVPGNFLEQTKRTFGLLITPLFLLFLFALFIPFASQGGAIVGALVGFVVSLLIAYWDLLTGLPTISFQWIFPVSLTAGAVAGCGWSLLDRRNEPQKTLTTD